MKMLKPSLSLVLVSWIVVLFSGCDISIQVGDGGPAVQGSGVSAVEERDISEFHAVILAGAGSVNFRQADETSLTVTTDDNLQELVETEVADHVLTIKLKESVNAKSGMKFDLAGPKLERLQVDGAGTVVLSGVSGESLTLEINGAGKVTGDGSVEKLKVSLNGASSASLGSFESENTTVKLAGAGSATVHASQSVDATVDGVGSIKVVGGPTEINKVVNGIGTISVGD